MTLDVYHGCKTTTSIHEFLFFEICCIRKAIKKSVLSAMQKSLLWHYRIGTKLWLRHRKLHLTGNWILRLVNFINTVFLRAVAGYCTKIDSASVHWDWLPENHVTWLWLTWESIENLSFYGMLQSRIVLVQIYWENSGQIYIALDPLLFNKAVLI